MQRTPSLSDDAEKDHPESKVYRSAEGLVDDSAVDVSEVEPPAYIDFYRLFGKALAGQGGIPLNASDYSAAIHLTELVMESSKKGVTILVLC